MKGLLVTSLAFLLSGALCAQSDAVPEAMDAMQRGDLPGAEQLLRAALLNHPGDPAALDVLGVVLDQENKFTAAEAVYQRAVAADPGSASIRNNYGNHLLVIGQSTAAESQFLQALSFEPANQNANLQLARLALQKKKGAQALSHLGHLQAQDRQTPSALLLTGMAWSLQARYADAERTFEQLVTAKPGDFEALYDLGLAASKAGHLQRAQAVLQEAAKRQPDNPDVLYDLSVVSVKSQQDLEALALLAHAASISPQRSDVQQLLARTAADCGYFEDSIQAWDRYLQQVPEDDAARRERGFAQTAIGKDQQGGLAAIREFTRKHPNDAVGHYELGTALSANSMNEALQELSRALQLKAHLTGARVARGLLNYRMGNVEDAVIDFSEASRLEPHNPRILDRLGETQLAANRPDRAILALQKASSLTPDDPSVLLHLGRALSKSGQPLEASKAFARYRHLERKDDPSVHEAGLIEFLALPPQEQQAKYRAGVERTVKAQPQNAEAQLRYLEVLLEEGNEAQAVAVAQTLLALKPDGGTLSKAANLLLESEQYSAARDFLTKAIAMVGPQPELQLKLAQATFHAVSPQAALAEMQEINSDARTPGFYLARAQMLNKIGGVGGVPAAR